MTGLPATRYVQGVSGKTLRFLWRVTTGVDVGRQLAAVDRFRLWESPCGLAFFEPMLAGDKTFYAELYGKLGEEGPWQGVRVERTDYARVAAAVRPGELVLDVGCGPAGFARWLPPEVRYVGIERSEEARRLDFDVRNETVAEHAVGHPDEYDVVCSFHVVEHIPEPGAFAADMARCLRPGGRLFIAVPGWPGAMTDIPNFALNAPPHHLSWWTEDALRALAERAGLVVESVETLPPSPHLGLLYWMGRLSPRITGERYFRHAWGWYGALIWSWLAGRVCYALRGPPAATGSFELLLTAHKPG